MFFFKCQYLSLFVVVSQFHNFFSSINCWFLFLNQCLNAFFIIHPGNLLHYKVSHSPEKAVDPGGYKVTHMFIHCHSVHDYPALPPEAAYKWPLKRGGQGVGRAEWPGCWLRHFLTALSRSLSRPFILAVDERKKEQKRVEQEEWVNSCCRWNHLEMFLFNFLLKFFCSAYCVELLTEYLCNK